MARIYDIRQKEVINVKDGGRFGFVSDIELDEKKGHIKTLIIPVPGKIWGMFGREQEYHIPWECVKQIGDDLILIECETDKVLKDCD